MKDLLKHLNLLTLYEIEADLEDKYGLAVHNRDTNADDVGVCLAAVSEELVRRDKEDE